ncbi:S-layer homology domain-containing protein, partial [Bacillus cereus]|nr:S-layer homology domain-containing protein [Bacillus cereus]
KFEDLKGHWGEKYANILIDLNISNGTDNGWQPNRSITRAEAAQLTAKTDMLSRDMNSELKEKDYTSTNTLLNQHQKLSGKVIEKTNDGLVVSGKNSSVYAIVSSPEVLKDIQIGDTVTVYAPMFIGSIPGDPATAKYAIVQKENEENVLKKQYKMHTGSVINKKKDTIQISNEGLTVTAAVSSEVLEDIQVGDTVTIYGASFMSNMASGDLSAKAPIIEKLASKTVIANTSVDKSKSISEVDKKEQNALNQHQKLSGKVIEKTEDGLVVSGKNSSVYAIVSSPEVLKDIQIGDTVTIYAPMFIGSIPGDPATAKYAIVQKENEENVLKKQYKMHTGSVINKTKDTIEISSEGSTVRATVSSEVLQDINIGDTITIYGASFMSNMASGDLSAKAPIIEKLASKTVTANTSVDKSRSASEVDKKEQHVLDQHQKRSGKVTEKTEDGLVVSGEKSSVYAIVSSPEVLKNIQIGDTVTVYAPVFIGSIPGDPATAKYVIVQKENEENVLEKQYKMHTGSVINKTKETIQISSEGLSVTAVVSSKVLEDIQVGDTVTIYGADFMSNMASGDLSAKAPIIEKLAR